VVIGAEHCRRQLSQWQLTQEKIGGVIAKLTALQKHLPRCFSVMGIYPFDM
jgi:hypothetical protein